MFCAAVPVLGNPELTNSYSLLPPDSVTQVPRVAPGSLVHKLFPLAGSPGTVPCAVVS